MESRIQRWGRADEALAMATIAGTILFLPAAVGAVPGLYEIRGLLQRAVFTSVATWLVTFGSRVRGPTHSEPPR